MDELFVTLMPITLKHFVQVGLFNLSCFKGAAVSIKTEKKDMSRHNIRMSVFPAWQRFEM